MMKTHFRKRSRMGYTLIEVLAAAAVVSVGMAAMISLSSSMIIQEELALRTAVTRNHQENMARLWQLGLSPANIAAVMPIQKESPKLDEAFFETPTITQLAPDPVEVTGLGKMQKAEINAIINISADLTTKDKGGSFTVTAYRPYLPETLRTPARGSTN